MKERKMRCKLCGERFTVLRLERERTPAYYEVCREERRREHTCTRMQAVRASSQTMTLRSWKGTSGATGRPCMSSRTRKKDKRMRGWSQKK